MELTVGSIQVAKRGAARSETDDALGVSPEPGRGLVEWSRSRPVRVMVSDGATESYLSGGWAQHLVTIGLGPERASRLADVTKAAVATWQAVVSEYAATRDSDGRPLAWYEERKSEQGSAATLAVMDLEASPAAPLRALLGFPVGWARIEVIGDCLAVLIRAKEMVASHPTSDPESFSNMPELARSTQPSSASSVKSTEFPVRRDDVVLLMTDAVGAWALGEDAAGRPPWPLLISLASGQTSDVEQALVAEREAGVLRNDDLSVVVAVVK